MKTYVLKEKSEPPSSDMVWAFDLGKGSIGEAVRRGNEFLHKASLLIPAEFAETRTARDHRRMWRTRQAHMAREQWLNEVMRETGIEVLHGRNYDTAGNWKPGEPADKRLEQEFAKPGDSVCYTSCLLRIKLLQGEKLESWQVYKALHSAIQKRGYGKVPWAAKEAARHGMTPEELEKKEKADLEKKDPAYKEAVESWSRFMREVNDPRYHYPSYYDAAKMGLWNPKRPDVFLERTTCRAQSTRKVRFDRTDVEKEIRALVDGAAKHYPKLKGKASYILYGTAETAYASFDATLRKKHGLKEGGVNDWQGVLGQKIPRFDNRIIAKCALIPRLNVCKLREKEKGQPHPQSLVAVEVAFLMKLKNLRIQRPGGQGWLLAEEIHDILENPKRDDWKFSKSVWKKFCVTIGAIPLPGHEEIESPRLSGRSRFCRPALEVLKRLILSGQKPSGFLREEIKRLNGNKDPFKGLVETDLKFLADMAARNDTWEGIYIPNQQLDALTELSTNSNEAITRLIGQQNDPIVRHRLNVFYKRLCELEKISKGQPDSVVLEFVREDFMGKKAKIEYNSFIKKRAEERIKAREEAAKVGATEKSSGLKLELLRAQDGRCLYTDDGLIPSKLDEYEIEHIVPRTKGGPDAVVNYVLTTKETNTAKANRIPYEWFHQEMPDKWDAYVNRVRSRALVLRNKKVQLLISPNAEELAEKYTALAETAWIAKLAQAIVGLHFGWRNGVDENGNKRVTVISGGLTGRIRRKYGLNQVLNPNAKTEEEAEKKNRDDDRHHALDAMVISFIPSWGRDSKKESFFRFPEPIHKNAKGFFEKEIASVIPQSLCFEKAALAETIYGARGEGEKKVIVLRVELFKLAYTTVKQKQVFDLDYLRDQIKAVRDARIQALLAAFHATSPDEAAWKNFCNNFQLPRQDGSAGSRVLSVLMDVGEPKEYKDLSKDGTGAYRKALKGHKGQIVYVETSLDKKGKTKETVQVRPVYAFESETLVRKELAEKFGDKCRIIGFFQSGCLVEVDKPVAHTKHTLPPGKYRLNTILTDSKNVKVTTADGKTYPNIPRYNLGSMVAAGLKRVE